MLLGGHLQSLSVMLSTDLAILCLFADCLLMPDWNWQVSQFACSTVAPFSENQYDNHSQKCGISTQRP